MIPKFSYYFRPFLNNLKEKDICSLSTLSEMISKSLNLSKDDLVEKTKGGSVTKHKSNIHYCAAYLKKMGLIESPKHGIYKITPRGIEVLNTYGEQFDLSKLRELPEYMYTQYNPNNENMVIIKAHMKGGKMVGAYACRKDVVSKDNPHMLLPKSQGEK